MKTEGFYTFSSDLTEISSADYKSKELEILFYLFSLMYKDNTLTLTVKLKEIRKAIEYSRRRNEAFLKEELLGLIEKIKTGIKIKINGKYKKIELFEEIEFYDNTSSLVLRVNEVYKKLLLGNIKDKRYVKLDRKFILSLKSRYSKYIYIKCVKFKRTGIVKIQLEDLKEQLNPGLETKVIIQNIKKSLNDLKEKFYNLKLSTHYSEDDKRHIDYIEIKFSLEDKMRTNEKTKYISFGHSRKIKLTDTEYKKLIKEAKGDYDLIESLFYKLNSEILRGVVKENENHFDLLRERIVLSRKGIEGIIREREKEIEKLKSLLKK